MLLIDHANCEKKAASTALSLMFAYAEDLDLTDKMSRLAREELRHYEQVAKLLKIARNRAAAARARPLCGAVCAGWWPRPSRSARSICMICGAIIEARSCERFAALGGAIGGAAGQLFAGLHAAEARHYRLYLDLARRAAARAGIELEPAHRGIRAAGGGAHHRAATRCSAFIPARTVQGRAAEPG